MPVRPEDLVLTPSGLSWQGHIIPCSVGRGGIRSDKREGDGATPVGIHHIVGMFYRPDRLCRPSSWATPIGPGDLWCDASGHPAYNRHVRAPFHASHEVLRRADPLYDIVIVTGWNWPDAQPGRGSAIFLHQWRRPGFPTAGCIAMARRDLFRLAQEVPPMTRLIVPETLNGRRARRVVAGRV